MINYDIIIVGGGLAGLAMLDKINKSEHKVLLLDSGLVSGQPSSRPLVLTEPNAEFLGYKYGMSIKEVKLSVNKRPGVVHFRSLEHGLSAFGYVVDANSLYKYLFSRNLEYIAQNKDVIDVVDLGDMIQIKLADGDTLKSNILIAADGAKSTVGRCLGFNKVLGNMIKVKVLANVSLNSQVPAQLRFFKGGTLAFLPTSDLTGTIVATGKSVDFDMVKAWRGHLSIKHLPNSGVNYQQECFYLPDLVMNRVAFIGNAAHSLPPVGAQGFNLGCRGIKILSDLDLKKYNSAFKSDVVKVFSACDFLASGKFGALGLNAISLLKFLKHDLALMAI